MGRNLLDRFDVRHLIAAIGIVVLLGVVSVVAASISETAGSPAPEAPEPALASDAGAREAAGLPSLPVEPAIAGGDVLPLATAPVSAAVVAPVPAAPITVITDGELERGDSLAAALRRSNVRQKVIHLVTAKLSKLFDFRHAQPGHSFRLIQGLDGELLDFRYRTSPTESIHLVREDGRYSVQREGAVLTPRVSRIAGVVTSSLYGAISDLGEWPRLASDFTDVFAWDVDFSRTVRFGDEFQVLYERLYYTDETGNEVYAGPGRILAARYGGASGEHSAVYFESEEGRGGYYRPDGSSVERQFLVAPLRYSRISSSYTNKRYHPILNITRPHYGIDYAAKSGTSVWSVSDGEVIYRGWAGGFGNLVKIRHAKGYVSYYAHLSRFADALRVGDRVRQKQVIGFVGQTGLATGPHVCFRIAQNGNYVNPAALASPTARPIPEAAREAFIATRDTLLAELDAGPFIATGEAL